MLRSAAVLAVCLSCVISIQAHSACEDAGKPVTLQYVPRGSFVDVGGFDAYVTGGNATAGLVFVYDIFGFRTPQNRQIADRLADGGFLVIAPDFFRGKWWSANASEAPAANLSTWMSEVGTWEKVAPDVYKAAQYLKGKGVEKVGIVGFCWGCQIAMAAAADPTFVAVGCAHPSLPGGGAVLAEKMQAPIIMLPTERDPMEQVQAVLDKRGLGAKSVFTREFNNQVHGFMGARGNYSDPHVAAAAGKGVKMMVEFFNTTMKQ